MPQQYGNENSNTPLNIKWSLYFLFVVILSFTTRLYKVKEPAMVCWDEAHFGKYINFYMNETIFFDVHPPIGKILLTYISIWSGYEGNFSFENAGDDYKHTRYSGIRKTCASLGAASICVLF
ncbi:hypothetical protein HZS_4382, partial [Henneguya salminicola]